ncbi:SPOR domain-containing protein [Azonexus sp.]|uniref:SPOR domain-containing protein n=1 Tax=Azonexus sp. TaxID=1872668 RepID=UPI0035B44CA1
MEDNDAQLQLKKRARRRLVGAVFFVSVVALVLPMLMDHDPRPPLQDVEIRIPGQDEKPFNPAMVAVPQESEPGRGAGEAAAPRAVEAAPPMAEAPVQSSVEARPLDVAPAARVVETVRTQPVLGADGKPKKPADAPATEKPAAKPAESKPAKNAEKPPEKPAKPSPEKKPEPPAKPPAEKKAEAAKPAADDEAKRAAAILAGKPATAAPAASGAHLILIGAFTNEANVVNLRKKLGELGIKTYTEPLDSPQGRKIRVRAGPFPNRDAADKALARMQKIGVSGVVAPKP